MGISRFSVLYLHREGPCQLVVGKQAWSCYCSWFCGSWLKLDHPEVRPPHQLFCLTAAPGFKLAFPRPVCLLLGSTSATHMGTFSVRRPTSAKMVFAM